MCKKFVLILLFVFTLVCSSCGSNNPELITDALHEDYSETDVVEESSEELSLVEENASVSLDDMAVVPVYVCGAVESPGVYYLPAESIKADALDVAGGFSEGALKEAVNLAEGLSEGEKIYFPYIGEDIVISDNKEDAFDDGKININKASIEELLTLPGVGESKARDIIAYRETNGPFENISDIMNVAGIKSGVYNKIKDSIVVK